MNFEDINTELFFDLPVLPNGYGHVNIVLGAKSATGEVIRGALDMLDNAQMPGKFIFSGGVIIQDKITAAAIRFNGLLGRLDTKHVDFQEMLINASESAYMQSLNSDVHEVAFVDDSSTNTGENFENIKDYIKTNKITSANIFTIEYHQKRALMTARKVLGDDIVLSVVPVSPWGINKNNWSKMIGLKQIVKGEYKKVSEEFRNNYIHQGYCVAVNIEEERKRVIKKIDQYSRIVKNIP